MNELDGKHLVLGLTGGIAAYKAAELARRLQERGATVQVVMTEAATRFVTAVTMQALTGRAVFVDQWDARVANTMAHIDLSRAADAILVVPASTDFLAKLAHGLCDDLLSTMCIARECPLLAAPAMNRQMWSHPATQRNVRQLVDDGVVLLGPASGDQACGETGDGRMLEAHEILDDVIAFFQPKAMAGLRVLLTAGPTREPIDPVRAVTNHSSGKMGYAIARAAREAGADVTLVSGPTALDAPRGVERIDVETAREMYDAVLARVSKADCFIGVAAVADWHVLNVAAEKIKKTSSVDDGASGLTLQFGPNPDILATVASLPDAPFTVGFAAETDRLEEHAEGKLVRKKARMIVANDARNAFGNDENVLVVIEADARTTLERADKLTLARRLVGLVADRMRRASRVPSRIP